MKYNVTNFNNSLIIPNFLAIMTSHTLFNRNNISKKSQNSLFIKKKVFQLCKKSQHFHLWLVFKHFNGVPRQNSKKGPYIKFPSPDFSGFFFGRSWDHTEPTCKVSACTIGFPLKTVQLPDYFLICKKHLIQHEKTFKIHKN